MARFHAPRATRDHLPAQTAPRNFVRRRFREVAESYGFQAIETPSFESVELFAAHSGPEIKGSMLSFHCDHEEFALRPEMTAPVCRLMASHTLDGVPQPYKFYYLGSCFRYCPPRSGRYREFTQAGIECLGESAPRADAEVVATACRFLRALDLTGFSLRIGSIGIFGDVLSADLGSEDRAVVIGHLDTLLAIDEKCRSLAASNDPALVDELRLERMELAFLQAEADYDGPHKIADRPHLAASDLSAELPQEAETTFRRLWSVQGLVPTTTADLLIRVSRLRGPLSEVHGRARALLEGTPATESLEHLLAVCRHVEMYGLADFEVVLGIARGFTFYTSTVFEILSNGEGTGRKLCGGGRYDRLVEDFGGPPLPATGCAFRFDALVEAFVASRAWTPSPRYQLHFLVSSKEAYPAVLRVAETLRGRGLRVGVEIGAHADDPSPSDLSRRGTSWLALVTPADVERGRIRLGNGSRIEEVPFDADVLAAKVTGAAGSSAQAR